MFGRIILPPSQGGGGGGNLSHCFFKKLGKKINEKN